MRAWFVLMLLGLFLIALVLVRWPVRFDGLALLAVIVVGAAVFLRWAVSHADKH